MRKIAPTVTWLMNFVGGDRQERGWGWGWCPARLRAALADGKDRPAVPPGTGVRGVPAARVAFVVGRDADGLRGGFLGTVDSARMGDDPYGVLVISRVRPRPMGKIAPTCRQARVEWDWVDNFLFLM